MVANKILVFITTILYNDILSDMETGDKLFKREVVADLNLKSKGFDIKPELTATLLKRACLLLKCQSALTRAFIPKARKSR
mgnify:CR=1 FL=1